MDAIYARQSIDKKGSLSIEGQIELCRKFTVDDALVFSDKGFSGKNTTRRLPLLATSARPAATASAVMNRSSLTRMPVAQMV